MEQPTPEERFERAMQALMNKDAPATPEDRRHAADAPACTGPPPGRAARTPTPGHAGEESPGGAPVSWSSLQYSPSREMRELLLRRGLAVPLRGEGAAGSPTGGTADGTAGAPRAPRDPRNPRDPGAGSRADGGPGAMEVDGGGLHRHLLRLGVSPPERDAMSFQLGALAAARAGRPWATGPLRISADWSALLALALPSSQAVAFRPWDRGDLQRRISTFKSSTWFAKPQVISPSECARRGWINSGADMLMCEVCRAMLSMATPLSWARAQVEKAASASAARLDSAHKAQCPWRGSSCDRALLWFPGQTPESLHTAFVGRSAALAGQAALPVLDPAALRVMEHAALEAVPGSPRSRLQDLLGLSDEVPLWQWEGEGGLPSEARAKALSGVDHNRGPRFQDFLASLSFAQVVMVTALCGWRPRPLSGKGEGRIPQLGLGPGQVPPSSPGTAWGLTVLECPLCGASVGVWNFCTMASGSPAAPRAQGARPHPELAAAARGALQPAEGPRGGPGEQGLRESAGNLREPAEEDLKDPPGGISREPAEGHLREATERRLREPGEGGLGEPGEGGAWGTGEEIIGQALVPATSEGEPVGAMLFEPLKLSLSGGIERGSPQRWDGSAEIREQLEGPREEAERMGGREGSRGDEHMESPGPKLESRPELVPEAMLAPGPALGSPLFHLGLTIAGGLTPTKLAVGGGREGASLEAGLPVFGAHLSLEASQTPPPPASQIPPPPASQTPPAPAVASQGPHSGGPAAPHSGSTGAPPAPAAADGRAAGQGSVQASAAQMLQGPGQGTSAAGSGAGTGRVGSTPRLLNSESFVGRNRRRHRQGPTPVPRADTLVWPFPVDSAEAGVADMEGADEGEECDMSYRGPVAQASQGQSVEAPRQRGLRRPRGGDVGMTISEAGENRPGDGDAESMRSRPSREDGGDPLPLPLTPAVRPGAEPGQDLFPLGDEVSRRSSPRKRQRYSEGQPCSQGAGPGAPEAFSVWEGSLALPSGGDGGAPTGGGRDAPEGIPLKKRRAQAAAGSEALAPPHDAPRSRVPGSGQGLQGASSGRPPAPRFPAVQLPGTSANAGSARAAPGLRSEQQRLASQAVGMAAAGATRADAASEGPHPLPSEPQGTRGPAAGDAGGRRLHADMRLPGSCTSLLGQFGAVCGPTQDDDGAAATREPDASRPGPQALSRADAQAGPGHSVAGVDAQGGGSSRGPAIPAAEGEGSWDDAQMGHAQEEEQEQQGESVAGGQGPLFPGLAGEAPQAHGAESTAALPGSAAGPEEQAAGGEGLDAFGEAGAPEGHGEGGEGVGPLGAGRGGGRSALKQGASSVFATNTDFSAGAENSADSVDNLQGGAGDDFFEAVGADTGMGPGLGVVVGLGQGQPGVPWPMPLPGTLEHGGEHAREGEESGRPEAGAQGRSQADPELAATAGTVPLPPVEGMGEGGLDSDMPAEPLPPVRARGAALVDDGAAGPPALSSAGEQGPSRSSGERREFLHKHALARRLRGGPEASAASAGVIRAPQEAGGAPGRGEREEGIISRSDREGREAEGEGEGDVATNAGMIRYGSAGEETEAGLGGSGSVDKGAGFELEVEAEAQEGNVVDEPGPLLGALGGPEAAAAGLEAAFKDLVEGQPLGQGIPAGPGDVQVPSRSVVGGTSGLGQGALWADSVGGPLDRASLREAAGGGVAQPALSFGMASAAQESPGSAQRLVGTGEAAALGSFLPSEGERGQSEVPQHASLFDEEHMQGSPEQPGSLQHADAHEPLGGGQESQGLGAWPADAEAPLEEGGGEGPARQQASREDTTEGKLVFDDLDGEGEAQTGGWHKAAGGEEEVEECGVPGTSREGPGASAAALHGASLLGGIAAGPGAMAAGLEAVGESRPHEGLEGGRSVAESAPAGGWQAKAEQGVQEGSNFAQSSRRSRGDLGARAAQSVAMEGSGEAQGLAEGAGQGLAEGAGDFNGREGLRRVDEGEGEPASSRQFLTHGTDFRGGHLDSPAALEVTAEVPQMEGRLRSEERVGDSQEALLRNGEDCQALQEEPSTPGPAYVADEDTATGPEAAPDRNLFDPLSSHRPFCPWITCANATSARGMIGEGGASAKDVASVMQQASKISHPGWLQCLLGVHYILFK